MTQHNSGALAPRSWPLAARRVVSILLVVHCAAMLAVALAGRPASELQRLLASPFAGYVEFAGLGSVHRYYAPAPPPTPVVTAELEMRDGSTRSLRLPDRSVRPRLRYQRQLALAYHLYNDYQRSIQDPEHREASVWGASYGRHLLATVPGVRRVTLRAQQHLVPDLVRLRAMQRAGQIGRAPDADDPAFFTVPEVIGEYTLGQESQPR